jgi:DNA-binding transcriptional MerR regulator
MAGINHDELISSSEAAAMLKVSPRTIVRYRNSGLFPYIQYSKRAFLYKKKDIILFLESRYHEAVDYLE